MGFVGGRRSRRDKGGPLLGCVARVKEGGGGKRGERGEGRKGKEGRGQKKRGRARSSLGLSNTSIPLERFICTHSSESTWGYSEEFPRCRMHSTTR